MSASSWLHLGPGGEGREGRGKWRHNGREVLREGRGEEGKVKG